jgi:N-acetylneuraminic acid mutarotase
MSKIQIIVSLQIFCLLVPACSEEETEEEILGNWTKVSPFKGRPRSGAITFTIDSKAFVGLGYNGDEYLQDFYSYDINQGFWEARKPFPGELREHAVSFSVNGKGYIGLGYNRELNEEELGDFWEYDPTTDNWTQLSDFAGTARYSAIGFSVGSRAFVGTGFDGDGFNSDFWEFDFSSGTWMEIQSYPGEKIERGVSFVIGNKGYVCSGRNNGIHSLDFWEFDPEGAIWTRLSPTSDDDNYEEFKLAVLRHDAVAFTIENKAYITGGISSSGATDKSIYEFDASTGDWIQKTPFEGSARSLPSAFVLNGRAFVGTGQNGSNYYDDIWEFKPLQEYDEEN